MHGEPNTLQLLFALGNALGTMQATHQLVTLGLVALGGLVYFWFTSLRFVQEAEQGLRLRFGRVVRDRTGKPKIYEPGALCIVPHIEQLVRHSVRHQTVELPPQEFILMDRTIWRVDAVLLFVITDIYRAKFQVSGLEESLVNMAMATLRRVLQQVENFEQLQDIATIDAKLIAAMEEIANEWGLRIERFELRDCAPVGETGAVITSKALVKARLAALKDAEVGDDPMTAAVLLSMPTVATITDRPKKAA